MAYDIFISYRRKGAGAGVAGELQAKLENRGYHVFLDVDDIGSGAFPMQIENAIKECNDFLLVLSPGTLDHCSDENDWVRHEIALAEQNNKNIVGVALPGFVMPKVETLPLPLHDLPQKQVFLWSHEYRNASLEKIEENLVSRQQKRQRHRRTVTWVSIVAAVAIIAVVIAQLMRPSPTPEVIVEEKPPFVDTAKVVQESFVDFVHYGDSLLEMYPEPGKYEEFTVFMKGIACYDSALALSREHPEIVFDTQSLIAKRGLKENLRKETFDNYFELACIFNEYNYRDSLNDAFSLYNNAKVLATEAERSKIDSLGQLIMQKQ